MVETILKEAIKRHETCAVPASLLLQLTVLPLPLAMPNINGWLTPVLLSVQYRMVFVLIAKLEGSKLYVGM